MRVVIVIAALIALGAGFSSLPPALEDALQTDNPLALADTTLPRLAVLDSVQRDLVAARIASWPVDHRVAAWAFLQVGIPYELGPLGEGAPPDTQPVLAFATADCATLNLMAAALAHRDAGGERESRLHFTTDRLDVSPY
jgi:hypothetical protein